MSSLRCVSEPDARSFADLALPWLLRDPVRHTVLCTLVVALRDSKVDEAPAALTVRVLDDRDVVQAVAVLAPPRALSLSSGTAEAARVLADYFAMYRPEVPAVDGPTVEVRAFVERFTARTGKAAEPGLRTRLYELARPVPPSGVPGALVEAFAADRAWMIDWLVAFSAETVPRQPPSDPTPLVEARLREGGLFWYWRDQGRPGSFLWLSTAVGRVVRISAVYTPPDLRGNGYASAAVAAVCRLALDRGADRCVLFTDLTNPTSNKIYQRIGFTPVRDGEEWIFRA